ncbi:OsmC family protein [Brevibacterium jeotgali]|uniref:Uncharacterized OsmC-related protein n=1 Tax=Brevibacterium jeotgali TaxID=1262550 RepID=A0A2H1L8E5_9MICO|nr:OsmC family protein [Brevibacterium jeotgali]TWC03358.1 putative OsmC-like protein [Brevibacterium jeotgali]SMY13020.1 Uncharacterized OsmC-related protein [Brevibacterium jeotgali]
MEHSAGEHVAEQRGVTVARTGFERYRVTTSAGVELEFGRGEGLVDPVDMLLAGLAGCMAVSIDRPLTRAGEPQRFDVDVVADKLTDEAMATRLQNLRVDVDVEFADWTRKQDPQAFVEKLLHAAHSTHCTVSRTIEAGARVDADATVAVTGTSAAVERE